MALKAHLEQTTTTIIESSVEGRRKPRRALRLETSGSVPGGASANVTIHNLSVAGLLIETDLQLSVGERLAIGLPDLGPVGVEIVWESERLYGCAFEQSLGEAALAAAQLQSEPMIGAKPVQLSRPNIGKRIDRSLGPKINRLRRERGLTLEQVANALGVSKPTVWAWEKGKAKPIPERIEGIAEVLGVSVLDLSGDDPDGSHESLLAQCRLSIASEYGIEADRVRIMIEV